MERLTITRHYMASAVVGFATLRDFNFFTLELPYLDNQKNISSIHPGLYTAIKYFSPQFDREVILLESVPNRTFIEIHPGNETSQILGCILPGDSIKYFDGDCVPRVTNSKNTLNKLLSILPDKFEISVS